jgi:peroxiredoxin
MPALQPGDVAPDINLPSCIGDRRDRFVLTDFRGSKNVVLVFYPLDWTTV